MALSPALVDREQGKFRDAGGTQTKVAVQIEGSDIAFGGGYKGTLSLSSASTVTNPGVEQTLITYAVPVSVSHDVHRVAISCRQDGKAVIEVNGSTVGVVRTSPSKVDAVFSWTPPVQATTGQTVTVKFTARSGTASSDVDAFLMADEY